MKERRILGIKIPRLWPKEYSVFNRLGPNPNFEVPQSERKISIQREDNQPSKYKEPLGPKDPRRNAPVI